MKTNQERILKKAFVSSANRVVLVFALVVTITSTAAAQTNTFPSSGNAGVGTASPGNLLQVNSSASPASSQVKVTTNGAGAFSILNYASDNVAITFDADWSSNNWIARHNSAAFLYKNGNKLLFKGQSGLTSGSSFSPMDRMAIDLSNGNIGVGTSSPGQRLNVIGNALFGDITSRTLLYSTYDSQQNPFIELGYGTLHSATTPLPTLVLSNNTTSTSNAEGLIGQIAFANRSIADNQDKRTAAITSWVDGASNSGTLQFYTANAGAVSERLRITSAGNVGIGTSTPGARLHVSAGDSSFALFGPNLQWGGSLAVGSGNTFSTPISGRAQVLSSNGNLHLDAGTTQSVYIGWLNASNTIINGQGGFVGVGTASPSYKLDVNGTAHVSGSLTVDGNLSAKYQDVAEWVPSSEQLAAGTVVVLDKTKSNQVIPSVLAYDTRVAGVISAQPGIMLGEGGAGKVLVATTGRVRVKVDATRGSIEVGDLLVSSDIEGVAMKSVPVEIGGVQIHRPGTLIGKALEPLSKGRGEILVLLSLQ